MALPSPCQGCWGWRERGRHRQPVLLRRRSSSPCGSVRAEFRSPWKAKNRLRAGSSAWCDKAGQRQRERGCAPSASQDRDRTSVGEGKSVSVRVHLGGRRIIQKKSIKNK